MGKDRQSQELLGVEICTYDGWDENDTFEAQLYKVEFPFESMKKFNGKVISINLEGILTVYSDGEDEETVEDGVLWKGYITDIPEFWEKLKASKNDKESNSRYIEVKNKMKEPIHSMDELIFGYGYNVNTYSGYKTIASKLQKGENAYLCADNGCVIDDNNINLGNVSKKEG